MKTAGIKPFKFGQNKNSRQVHFPLVRSERLDATSEVTSSKEPREPRRTSSVNRLPNK
jgi:hypothetical protein